MVGWTLADFKSCVCAKASEMVMPRCSMTDAMVLRVCDTSVILTLDTCSLVCNHALKESLIIVEISLTMNKLEKFPLNLMLSLNVK